LSAGPGRPKTYINVRVDAAIKQQLEQLAAAENLDLVTYLRKHYLELVQKGTIIPEEDVRIPNPALNNPPPVVGSVPMQPQYYPQYGPQYGYYPQYGYAQPPQQEDALDQFLKKMEKMAVARMFREIAEGKADVNDALALRASRGKDGEKDDMSMQDIMKMQMVQAQIDKQYQQQMFQAQQLAESARSKGDKQGESQALQLLTALSTAQMQQQQNFMQQFMLAQQNSSNVQQSLFTTALTGSHAQEEARAQERNQFSQQLQGLQQTMTTVQIAGLEKVNQVQVEFLRADLERVRNEPHKDVIQQMGDLLNMRNTNPVYKAAFDAAFGVKDESGIGNLIPKLKELGIDKVIDKVTGMLGSVFIRPPEIPQPTPPAPTPAGSTPQIPAPLPTPNPQELEKLRLPPPGQQPTGQEQQPAGQEQQQTQQAQSSETTVTIERPDNIGYSNLEAQNKETIQIPTPEQQETVQIPEQPSSQTAESPATGTGKVFTTGRKPGTKNKPKPT
jgi:hypothetical protein